MTGLLSPVALFLPGTIHDYAIRQAGPSILARAVLEGSQHAATPAAESVTYAERRYHDCPMYSRPLKPRQTVCASRCRVGRWRHHQATARRDREQELRLCLLAVRGAIDLALEMVPDRREEPT